LHLLNYKHQAGATELRDMRKLYEQSLSFYSNQLAKLSKSREALAKQIAKSLDPDPGALCRLDVEISAVRDKQQQQQDTIDEIDRRLSALAEIGGDEPPPLAA
jgi:hypothetical protein